MKSWLSLIKPILDQLRYIEEIILANAYQGQFVGAM